MTLFIRYFGSPIFFVLFIFGVCHSKPLPPPELLEILEINSEFEESYEAENWSEVIENLNEIAKELAENQEYAEKYGSEISRQDFNSIILKIKAAVEEKDKETVEKNYIFYQKSLFNYMNQFEYEFHPILLTIEKYITDEAKEAAEEGNYSEVKSELKEVAVLFNKANEIFKDRAVSKIDLDRFSFQLRKTLNDCDKNPESVKAGVLKLEELLKPILEKAHN